MPPERLALRLSSEVVPIQRLTILGNPRWLDLSDYGRLREAYAAAKAVGVPKIEIDFSLSRAYECQRWLCEISSPSLSTDEGTEPNLWGWASLDDTPVPSAVRSHRSSNDSAAR